MLQCAACGAPCAPDDGACSYCSAVLAVIACPACFGRVFPGSDHCPHCGAAVSRAAGTHAELARVRACPRCEPANELVPRLLGETLLDECSSCCGVWLQSHVFESLVKNRDEQARLEAMAAPEIKLEERSLAVQGDAPPSRSQREYIPCPDCRQLMNRRNFGNISGVLVDICKAHGIWFDKGELGRIMQFVMRGGLATVRKREVEKENREERERRANEIVIAGLHEPASRETEAGWVGDLLQIIYRLLQ